MNTSESVDVYWVDCASHDYAAFLPHLSQTECTRAVLFRRPEDAARFIIRRGALRALLAARMGSAPADVPLIAGEHGKAALADGGIEFNLSHSADAAVIAFAPRPVGIDIEFARPIPDYAAAARRFFAPAEHAALMALPNSAQLAAFYSTWTRKEAFVKALGVGLRRPLESFTTLADAIEEGQGWSLDTMQMHGAFISICVQGARLPIRVRRFE